MGGEGGRVSRVEALKWQGMKVEWERGEVLRFRGTDGQEEGVG